MLTIDEGLILEMYAKKELSRITTLGIMADAMKYIDDPAVLEVMQSTIRKIETMSDNEYKHLEFASINDFAMP